jgi:hypothetical protein
MALDGRFNDSAARQFHLHTVADFVIGHGCRILPRAVEQPYSERRLLLGGSALTAAADETSDETSFCCTSMIMSPFVVDRNVPLIEPPWSPLARDFSRKTTRKEIKSQKTKRGRFKRGNEGDIFKEL